MPSSSLVEVYVEVEAEEVEVEVEGKNCEGNFNIVIGQT